ncbi:TPA: preprotein translocase subunit Sec61beta [archaeon]|uniref:Preprotein translocase subunit Sec61beta n=1 Tax=Candidatus Naiadarchaeum limnaeum TaxID=2756139 RepID=A0A832V2U2_9ARCH|nr:preprotein translocase subunit Sec61beta [Candidatus Naiadarchaeum limnaeum]
MAEKIRLPSSEGGLVRYSDEDYPSKLQLKPEYIIGFAIAVIVIFAYLAAFGGSLFN